MNKLIYFDRAFEHLLTITKGLTDTTQDFYQAFQTAGDSANSTQQSTYSFCRTVFANRQLSNGAPLLIHNEWLQWDRDWLPSLPDTNQRRYQLPYTRRNSRQRSTAVPIQANGQTH